MHQAAVEFLVGTDEVNPCIFPGFSLHDELALLVKTGLTPAAALRAATVYLARLLRRQSLAGTTERVKAADLVRVPPKLL
jgi:imidazolonepropionase-like amidohydrolase